MEHVKRKLEENASRMGDTVILPRISRLLKNDDPKRQNTMDPRTIFSSFNRKDLLHKTPEPSSLGKIKLQ